MTDLSDDDPVGPGPSEDQAKQSTGQILQCRTCGQEKHSRQQLKLHIQKHHPKVHKCQLCPFSSVILSSLKEHMTAAHKNSKLACEKCPYVAVWGGGLRNHRRTTHASTEGLRVPRKNFLCRHERTEDSAEGGCQESFSRRDDLRKHLAEQHGLASAEEKIEVEFTSTDEFKSWKADYERRKGVYYTMVNNHVGRSTLFECSRSGVYAPSGSSRRHLKSQGSAKLGLNCTSALHLRERDGALSVVLYPHHHGHSDGAANLPYVRIPAEDRALAKAQLLAGIAPAQIVKNLRENCSDANADAGPNRAFFVQRRDVLNMRQSIGISAGGRSMKHANEAIRERMHAEQLRASDQCAGDQMCQMVRRQLWQSRSLHGDEISRRHAIAVKLVNKHQATATPVTDSLLPAWDVRCGAETAAQLHRVEQEHCQCPEPGCRQRCEECRACTHHFRCSCPDWKARKLVCKHIHAVCLLVESVSQQLSQPDPPSPDPPEDVSAGESAPEDMSIDMTEEAPQSNGSSQKARLVASLAALPALGMAISEDAKDLMDAVQTKVLEIQQLIAATPRTTSSVTGGPLAGGSGRRSWNTQIVPRPSSQSRRAKRPRSQVTAVHVDVRAACNSWSAD